MSVRNQNPYNPAAQNLIVVEYSGDEEQSSYLDRVRNYPQNKPKPQLESPQQYPNRSIDLEHQHNRGILPMIVGSKRALLMV